MYNTNNILIKVVFAFLKYTSISIYFMENLINIFGFTTITSLFAINQKIEIMKNFVISLHEIVLII